VRIYFDHNATTPLRSEVVDAMTDCLRECYGNPSSTHAEGRAARQRLDRARAQVAGLFGVDPTRLTFTGSATEANNTVIAHALADRTRPSVFVATEVEHPSVEEPLLRMQAAGEQVIRLPVDSEGILDPADLENALHNGAALVSVIWANNETGTLQPVAEVAALCERFDVPLHLDATQAAGKVSVHLNELPAAFVTASAHKFNGPKGVGVLIARDAKDLRPWVEGGPQEARRRGGTENLAGIVGMGVAAELATRELAERAERCARLRDQLWDGIRDHIPDVRRNGSAEQCLPNTLNLEFVDTAGDVLLEALDLEGISASAGAACASGSITPSRVLVAMGLNSARAHGSLRFSVGHENDEDSVARVLEVLREVVPRVRSSRAA